MNRRHRFLLLFSALTLTIIPFIVILLITNNYGFLIEPVGFYLFTSYFLYLRYMKGVKPKYPLASPVKDQDIYFPRTDIPRPIHQDYREHPEFFEDKKKRERAKGKA